MTPRPNEFGKYCSLLFKGTYFLPYFVGNDEESFELYVILTNESILQKGLKIHIQCSVFSVYRFCETFLAVYRTVHDGSYNIREVVMQLLVYILHVNILVKPLAVLYKNINFAHSKQ